MIRVLVVDDSALVRRLLEKQLNAQPGITVVGTAVDPYVAREKIAELSPDVITLDLELPRMDGLTFLEKLMTHLPLPVIVVSSLAPENSAMAMRALSLGAVGVVPKPDGSTSVPAVIESLASAIRVAANSKPRRLMARPKSEPGSGVHPVASRVLLSETTDVVVAIGSSTGGPGALETVLSGLPATFPGVVITQHMPPSFTAQLAHHLNQKLAMDIREAKDGDMVARGRVLIAPGGRHMELRRNGAHYIVRLTDGPPVHHVRPAVDVMFKSVAQYAGANAVGVVLTGMGSDGAEGLLEMRKAGATTMAEAEETCVVYGMPQAAVKAGGVQRVVRLDDVSTELLNHIRLQELKVQGGRPQL